eukprot:CAMPEP_0183467326 /NCGR_PEP_ID=MMETSP0370-20130417/150666_1 /TAXON_ID=268820 /ORGANISM="Peridinium aciculiferum, Strain PAER-2" /LENGTH=87 /DNA_ID=CAMNT_0025659659 /DNA_START=474 /DNA_END=738 /DNA_ORIENTATION=-
MKRLRNEADVACRASYCFSSPEHVASVLVDQALPLGDEVTEGNHSFHTAVLLRTQSQATALRSPEILTFFNMSVMCDMDSWRFCASL